MPKTPTVTYLQAMAALRVVLTAVGGILVGYGLMKRESVDAVTVAIDVVLPGLFTIGVFLWSQYSTWMNNQKLLNAEPPQK